MVVKKNILNSIKTLQKLYDESSNPLKSTFYCKLAILELCGWIEESMDEIVLQCIKGKIKDQENLKLAKETIIGKTHGFDYNKHFRRMLLQTIGLVSLEKLERRVNQEKLQTLTSTLGTLKTYRDSEAHTHVKGITKRLDAPSITKTRFLQVYEGLKEIEYKLRQLKL